nr:twin-arginine translocase TatA/TatE family subunit [Rhodococcus sp. (in: high G+C Gram-positive bacteria)]
MFGLTIEKLLLVGLVAGLVIGPQRLPLYAQQLGATIRGLRRMLESARTTTEHDLGVSLARTEWNAFDPRQYDPRRIVREALSDTPPTAVTTLPEPATTVTPEMLAEAERVRPGQKYLITGSSAHPHRVLIESLATDDPRRLASQIEKLPVTPLRPSPTVVGAAPSGEC